MCKVNSGFTLIELIIVMVLLSVLAVTTLPRLINTGGTEEITVQDQIVSVLRRMQIQAMQQTNIGSAATENFCHQLILTPTQLGRPNVNPCGVSPALTSAANADSAVQFVLSAKSAIQLSLFDTATATGGNSVVITDTVNPYIFRFNSRGQPTDDAGVQLPGLRIEITDAATYRVCIETEGYIHPCQP